MRLPSLTPENMDDEQQMLYQKTKDLIGEKGIVDLISLMGYYSMISMTLNVFEIPLPEGTTPPFED